MTEHFNATTPHVSPTLNVPVHVQHLVDELIDEYNQIIDRIGREQRLYISFVNSLYHYSQAHLLTMVMRHPRFVKEELTHEMCHDAQTLIIMLCNWDHETYPFEVLKARAVDLHEQVKLLDSRYHGMTIIDFPKLF